MENPAKEQRKSARNAGATRTAILESARAAFVQHGYDGIGVREIAEGAGVSAMLVNRYFGTKEGLFVEVAEAIFSAPGFLGGSTKSETGLQTLARDVAVALTARAGSRGGPMDGFLLLIRSVASEPAMAILREKLTAHIAGPLAARLRGKDADARAALFLALIAGIQLMRQTSSALADANPYDLADRLREQFELIALGD